MDPGEHALGVGDVLVQLIDDLIQLLLNGRIGFDLCLELGEKLRVDQWCSHFVVCESWRLQLSGKGVRATKAEILSGCFGMTDVVGTIWTGS